MAEKEKRRSTTFVTSRGAIINVAAPSVYIAPGVTPADVTSQDELRETLDIHSAFTFEKFLREGVDAHFNARERGLDLVEHATVPSDYWVMTDPVTVAGHITCPSSLDANGVYSKRAFINPVLAFRTTFPDLSGYLTAKSVYVGFEGGGGGGNGLAAFWQYRAAGGVVSFRALLGTLGSWKYVDITNLLPANYTTTAYNYLIELKRNMAVFYIGTAVVAFGLITPHAVAITPILGPPYALFFLDSPISTALTTLLELGGHSESLTFNLSPAYFRVSDGDPLPPRTIRLYETGTNNLFAGKSVAAGTLTSHPVPVFGYKDKTVYFRAGVGGTVAVEVLSQTGNWREYYSDTVSANVLWWFKMTGDAVLARLVYTPASYPATVSEGEAVLSG